MVMMTADTALPIVMTPALTLGLFLLTVADVRRPRPSPRSCR